MTRKVDEADARAAVDTLVKGIADDNRRAGALPDMRAIEAFAHQIVGDTVARTERTEVPKLDKPTVQQGADPAAKRDDVKSFSRSVGTFDWNPTTNTFTARHLSERAKRKLAKRNRAPVDAEDARLQQLLRERCALLMQYPEWGEKLVKAYMAGMYVEVKRCLAEGMHTITEVEELPPGLEARIRSTGTDYALSVVEDSNRLFGDWKSPKATDKKLIV